MFVRIILLMLALAMTVGCESVQGGQHANLAYQSLKEKGKVVPGVTPAADAVNRVVEEYGEYAEKFQADFEHRRLELTCRQYKAGLGMYFFPSPKALAHPGWQIPVMINQLGGPERIFIFEYDEKRVLKKWRVSLNWPNSNARKVSAAEYEAVFGSGSSAALRGRKLLTDQDATLPAETQHR
jgi:hypothetical protein